MSDALIVGMIGNGFDPSRYKKQNVALTSAILTKNTYVTAINYTGRGKLGDIHYLWDNSTNEIKYLGIKVTIDGIICLWTVLSQNASVNPIFLSSTFKNKASRGTANSVYIVKVNSQNSEVITFSPLTLKFDGSTVAGISSAGTQDALLFEEPLYFKSSLKVEIFTDSASGTGLTSGGIEYYTES